jgi:homospermidine synthase
MWMIENPRRGRVRAGRPAARLRAGDLQALPGQVHFRAADWTPLKHYTNVFSGYNKPDRSTAGDPWQFKNFLVTDGD